MAALQRFFHSKPLKFFPHTEGYVEFKNNQYLYTYQYKDHLGNVRLTYRDGYKNHATQENVKDGIIQVTEIIDQTDYYPFGLKHNNNALADYSAVNKYKYAYNGKELNDELGVDLYDFGARNYDPALGRWLNVDPLAENSRRWTPYNYAYNNPVYFIDPDGMQAGPTTDYFNLKGQFVLHVPDGSNEKKMVLNRSTNMKKVEESIKQGHVIRAITTDEIKQIKEIYKFDSEKKSGLEQGYKRGADGSTSKTTTGKSGLWDSKASIEASKDLQERGTTATSDAHLHNLDFDDKGNVTGYGAPYPSEGDLSAEKNTSYTEPSMILGYKEKITNASSNTIGGKSTIEYKPTVGFYDSNTAPNSTIETIDLKSLEDTVKKIENYKP